MSQIATRDWSSTDPEHLSPQYSIQVNMVFPEPTAYCMVLLVQLQSELMVGWGMQVWAAQDGT